MKRKTPQFFKRQQVREVIDKILKTQKTILSPLEFTVSESFGSDYTETSFSFRESGNKDRTVPLSNIKSRGVVDGIFRGLHEFYQEDYPSIKRIRLVNLLVDPFWSTSKAKFGTDAKTSVVFRVEVDSFGTADFEHSSRSMLHSSFISGLNAFQFYINCERAFDRAQLVLKDAESRNRSDISDQWKYYLSKLTEANTYVKKGKKD